MRYQKPSTTIQEQIAIMRNRGLIVVDEIYARQYLEFIGYFRLAGYALPFQLNYNADGTHEFLPNTRFEDVVDLYVFDRKLRLLVIDALERIEVAVRATISWQMSERIGAHWYLDGTPFFPGFDHDDFLDRLKKDIGHDHSRKAVRQIFIQHYYDKYTDPALPPSWMVFEVLSLGTVSKIFKNLAREYQKPIAKEYELDVSIFASWLHALSYLRNLAAHHQRLWNRRYTIRPAVARKVANDLSQQDRFYAQVVMIQVLLKKISPGTVWGARLLDLFNEYPSIEIKRMGFPENWNSRDIWQ
ncbi:Abi family protein [Polynucleobacter sp. Fuers-14]|uniref:Abi family protein n=1 Tax=Polynucleobacter sp. Fuers-14 TaxID=1758364 RepID=UPI001C0BE2F9|nr:Abi family protein [Polynucleobacter sp. Fuers-14]MBU3641413.1 Abi family protein [Polynucleobacter sp. Fuers-14]